MLLPSWRNVRSFLITGNRGIIGGCRFWLLRTLRYFAIFLDGSNKSCRSWNSFSYLLGSFSQVVRSLATGAKFKPLEANKKVQEVKEQQGKKKKKKRPCSTFREKYHITRIAWHNTNKITELKTFFSSVCYRKINNITSS